MRAATSSTEVTTSPTERSQAHAAATAAAASSLAKMAKHAFSAVSGFTAGSVEAVAYAATTVFFRSCAVKSGVSTAPPVGVGLDAPSDATP